MTREPARIPFPVAVFAHNEEDTILDCLKSLDQSGVRPYVLLNGCTDGTERVVSDHARRVGGVEIVRITLGDKANAWNVFLHEVGPVADVWYFVDGDITVAPGALGALERTLRAHPLATAAAAVPRSGRGQERMTRLVTADRLLMGALYALSGVFVERLRAHGVRMPVGYIGDDGWVTSMAKWEGDPHGAWREDRVVPCEAAGYTFRSLSPFRQPDWRKYWNRRLRYSLRHFQHLLLRDALASGGLAAMPADVRDLYSNRAAVARLRARPGEFLFDWLALKEVRRDRRFESSR